MMRLLIIRVAYNMPQNRVSDTIMHVVLITMSDVVVYGQFQTFFHKK